MTTEQEDDLFDIFGIADLGYDEDEEAICLAKQKYPNFTDEEILDIYEDFLFCNPPE